MLAKPLIRAFLIAQLIKNPPVMQVIPVRFPGLKDPLEKGQAIPWRRDIPWKRDSHEIKRCLLLGRKVMTNIDSILKSRDIILPTKVHLVEAVRVGP